MPVKLRVAIRSDVESIMRMQRAAFAAAYRRCGDMYEGLERTAARELERAIGAPGSNCYVIVHAGRDVGVVRVARCGQRNQPFSDGAYLFGALERRLYSAMPDEAGHLVAQHSLTLIRRPAKLAMGHGLLLLYFCAAPSRGTGLRRSDPAQAVNRYNRRLFIV